MDHYKIVINNLRKEYIERRTSPRIFNENDGKKSGKKLIVLDNVNLKIKEGELVCLLGPSGSGKSTLLRLIAGFQSPTSGTIHIDDQLVEKANPNYIFMFQEGSLFPWMTVKQNIEVGVRNIGDTRKMDELVNEYIDIVELSGFEHLYPHQLSGGMRQRAEFARALVVKPEILFMDESFSGLDFLTRLKMREELLNMHMFIQKTMILVTHDIDEALQLADYLVVLSEIPAKIKYDIRIDSSHPRNLTDGFLADLRKEVYHQLGVHYEL